MLRLLILVLILQGSFVTSEDTEGNSSGTDDDDEDGDRFPVEDTTGHHSVGSKLLEASPELDKSTGDEAGGGTLVIIIAAVSVTILAIGCIVAIVLFRRYLQNREQGVYSVPVEQGQKAAV